MSGSMFGQRISVEQVEEGQELAPKFDAQGLIPVITTDFTSGELLMHGYMLFERPLNLVKRCIIAEAEKRFGTRVRRVDSFKPFVK